MQTLEEAIAYAEGVLDRTALSLGIRSDAESEREFRHNIAMAMGTIRNAMENMERPTSVGPLDEAAERSKFEAEGWVTRKADGEWDSSTWKCWRGWIARAKNGRFSSNGAGNKLTGKSSAG